MPPARRTAKSPQKPRPPTPKEKSPKAPRSKSPKATKVKTSDSAKEVVPAESAELTKRREELAAAREQLGLLSQPLATTKLFLVSTVEFTVTSVAPLLKSPVALFLGYPILLSYVLSTTYAPELYQEPGCGTDATPPGLLYTAQLYLYEAAWWLILGILSSIGFGTGLHSGIMFLWPFVMQVILAAEACDSTAFVATYNHPCVMECVPSEGGGGASFAGKLVKVLPAAILWGVGTALGELPPYFVTRAARRTGKSDASEFEAELQEAKTKTDLISRLKVWTIDFTQSYGFLGVFLLASWPNAAFDMCGMACGWLEMPFWTFLGATVLGKGFVKVTIQCVVCTVVFSKAFFDGLMFLVNSLPGAATLGASSRAIALRAMVMAKFELQRRFTPEGLLGMMEADKLLAGQETLAGQVLATAQEMAEDVGLIAESPPQLDATSLAQKFCSVGTPAVCGEITAGSGYSATWSLADKWAVAKATADRAVAALDADADGTISLSELTAAQSNFTDGKVSLASLDPGTGALLSAGNLWNLFLVALILFFLVSIVDQVAKMARGQADEKELSALAASKAKNGKSD